MLLWPWTEWEECIGELRPATGARPALHAMQMHRLQGNPAVYFATIFNYTPGGAGNALDLPGPDTGHYRHLMLAEPAGLGGGGMEFWYDGNVPAAA